MNFIDIRHGDLCLAREPIPTSVKLLACASPLVLAGHDTAPHVIAEHGALQYALDGETHRIRISAPVTLSHSSRHLPVTLEPGDWAGWSLAEMLGEVAQRVVD